jgi:hypothetical protein
MCPNIRGNQDAMKLTVGFVTGNRAEKQTWICFMSAATMSLGRRPWRSLLFKPSREREANQADFIASPMP